MIKNACIFGNGINLKNSDLLITRKILKRMLNNKDNILQKYAMDFYGVLIEIVYYKKWVSKWWEIIENKVNQFAKATYFMMLDVFQNTKLENILKDIETIILFWHLFENYKKYKDEMFDPKNSSSKYYEHIKFLFCDSIYAKGKINNIKLDKNTLDKLINLSNEIYTTNYDNNLEKLYPNEIINHLHGRFDKVKSNYDIKISKLKLINWDKMNKNKGQNLLKSNVGTWKSGDQFIEKDTIEKWYKNKRHLLSNIIIKNISLIPKFIKRDLSIIFDGEKPIDSDSEFQNLYVYGLSLINEDLDVLLSKLQGSFFYYCHTKEDKQNFISWKRKAELIYKGINFIACKSIEEMS